MIASCAALLALSGCGQDSEGPSVLAPRPEGPFRGGKLPQGLDRQQAPGFRLPDAKGGELDTRELRGRPYALTFLYTSCRDVCPLIAQEIREALRLLGTRRAKEVTALAVTVDPPHDTGPAVRRWLKQHRMPANFHYLLGRREELAPVWKSYFAAPQPANTPESRHTASIWLIDRRGRLRTKFSAGAPVAPRDLAHDLRLLLDEAGPAARSD